MKSKKLCFLCLLVIAIIFLPTLVFADSERVATTTEANPIQTNVQKKIIIWKDNIFLFYSNGVYMVYKHRRSFTTWSNETIIRACVDGKQFSVWLQESGISGYLHYVACLTSSYVYYRKGQLHTDGSISWVASEQMICMSVGNPQDRTYYPFVSVDTEGYPAFIVMIHHPYDGSTNWRTTIELSAKNDGTWAVLNNTTPPQTVVYTESYAYIYNQIIPMAGRSFLAIMKRHGPAPSYGGLSRYWNGTDWEFMSLGGIFDPACGEGGTYNAVYDANNSSSHLIYHNTASNEFCQRKWYLNGSWVTITSEDTVESNVVSTINPDTYDIRSSWLDTTNEYIYYKDWNGSAWTPRAIWYGEIDNIIEAEDFNSIYSSDSNFAITYMTQASRHIMFLASPPFPPFSEPPDIPHEPPWDVYIEIGMGFGGLGILIFLPFFLAIMFKDKKKDRWDWVIYAFMLFIIAIGLIIGWLWG